MDQTTELLSSFACDLAYEDLSPKVVHQVKRTVVDTLGCAVGGFHSEPATIARTLAGSITSSTPSRILGTQAYSSPDMAGFANGVMVRFLDCNDSYFSPGGGHPSDMIAAALALGSSTESDGRSVITAIALAYEVFCRLSDEVVVNDFGWDQGTFAIVGATCAAGKLLGLNREQMGHAISLSIAPSLPLGVTRTGELSMWKGCATATATRAGIFAAQLAQQGMTGPKEPFEGRRGLWEQVLGNTVQIPAFEKSRESDDFRILETTFKAYPAQIHTQCPTGLALELYPRIAGADIKSVRIQSYLSAVSSPATEPEKWDPKTRETADHSIPYLVASALQNGWVNANTFNEERIHDPALRALMAKFTMEEIPDFTHRYPEEYNCRIEITDESGNVYEAHAPYHKGHRSNPMDDGELEAKFRGLSVDVIAEEQCNRVLKQAWSLDELPNLDSLFDNVVV
jgi:2-methylcitrate dehydratase